MSDVRLREGDRWASFGREYHETASRSRHVVAKGKPTSACGITALPAEMWRRNTTKPDCPSCLAKLAATATAPGSGQ